MPVLFLIGLSVTGCDHIGTGPRACTLIGCTSGMTIVLEDRPATPYRIEAFSGSSTGAKYVFQCDNPGSCGDPFFSDFTPDRVFIDVIADANSKRYEVIPAYTESRPNGPECDPLCRQATIRLPSDQLH